MKKKKGYFRFSGFKISLVITLFLALLSQIGQDSPLLNLMEAKVFDLRFLIRGEKKPHPEIVILAIDEKSLEKLGHWPWPRTILAKAVDTLSTAGAAVLGFDIIFSEKQVTEGQKVIKGLEEKYQSLGLEDINVNSMVFYQELVDAEEGIDHDRKFASSIRASSNVIVPMFFDFDAKESEPLRKNKKELLSFISQQLPLKEYISNPGDRSVFPILKGQKVTLPLPEFIAAGGNVAHVNMVSDPDGAARWENLFIEFHDEIYPSFPLLAALLFSPPEEGIGILLGDGIYLGERKIPMDSNSRMLISYYGPENTFPQYSFSDLLSGELDPMKLKNKIVLIGATATGLFDQKVTPFTPALAGIEKQATVISNLLQGDFLVRGSYAVVIDLIVVIALGIILGLTLPIMPIFLQLFIVLVSAGGHFFGVQYVFEKMGLWINTIFPVLEILLVYISITVFQFFTETKQKKFIQGAFGQYLAPVVIDQLIKDPSKLNLGGEKKILTAFFSDLAGFSGISEKLSPEHLVNLLNIYLTDMSEILMRYGGTVDKFEGDAIIAFFGAPVSFHDHTKKACLASLEMQKRLKELNLRWEKEGTPLLHMRIGINTGPMIVGNMGSKTRMDYTIMGDAVNLASRLEGANKHYNTETMLSNATYEACKENIEVRELGSIQVVGKKDPVVVYELLSIKGDLDPAKEKIMDIYHSGLSSYKQRRWEKAIKEFNQVLDLDPKDGPSLTYLERCTGFQQNPPEEGWNGVYVLKEK